MSNCPNCGAPITGPVCEYCDTRFPEYRDITECWADTVDGKRIIFNGVSSGILTPNEARDIYCENAGMCKHVRKYLMKQTKED